MLRICGAAFLISLRSNWIDFPLILSAKSYPVRQHLAEDDERDGQRAAAGDEQHQRETDHRNPLHGLQINARRRAEEDVRPQNQMADAGQSERDHHQNLFRAEFVIVGNARRGMRGILLCVRGGRPAWRRRMHPLIEWRQL